ncbi:MAG: hypothetical protein Q9157_007251 [Trypethelium eluteriae]
MPGQAHPQSDESPAILAFHKWFDENLVCGSRADTIGSQEEPPKFIPSDELKAYFDNQCLRKILKEVFAPGPQVYVEVDAVEESYRKVFAILICIKKSNLITEFIKYPALTDSYLPFRQRPDDFPHSANTETDCFEAFSRVQWMFCAPLLRYYINQHWEPNRILPIVHSEKIGHGGSAETYKIRLHHSHNRLDGSVRSQEGPHSNIFVLKTFHKYEEQHYENEVRAFATLRKKVARIPGLVTFFGSFVQGNTFHILLEYADGGTLQEYLDKVPRPTTHGQRRDFWKSLLPLTKALKEIHQVDIQELQDTTVLRGQVFFSTSSVKTTADLYRWHQDINLSNILCSGFNPEDPYHCKFKLADLGLSHFTTKISNRVVDKDAKGTKTFGAPECYSFDDFDERSTRKISQEVDVWSLGCGFSIAAEWLYHGQHGVKRYEKDREEEQQEIEDFRDTGCFHNGSTVLRAVKKAHQGIYDDTVNFDSITGPMLDLIKDMLEREDVRPSAGTVYQRSRVIMSQNPGSTTETGGALSDSSLEYADLQPSHVLSWPQELPFGRPGNPDNGAFPATYGRPFNNIAYSGQNQFAFSEPHEIHSAHGGRHNSPGIDSRATSREGAQIDAENSRGSRGPDPGHFYPQHSIESSDFSAFTNGIRSSPNRTWSMDTPSSPRFPHRPSSKVPIHSAGVYEWVDPSRNIVGYFSPSDLERGETSHDLGRFEYQSQVSIEHTEGGHSQQAQRTLDHSAVYAQGAGGSTQHSGRGGIDSARFQEIAMPKRPEDFTNTSRPIAKGAQPQLDLDDDDPPKPPTSPRTPHPVFPVQDALRWWKSSPSAFVKLPLDQLSNSYLLEDIQKRDQVILLDDSQFMRDHWNDVVDFLGLHVYMIQDADPDGVEVFLTSKSHHTKKRRPTAPKDLQNFARQHQPKPTSATVTNMYTRLNAILEPCRKKIEHDESSSLFARAKRRIRPLRPLSITVYTDGRWQEGSEAAAPIRKMMNTLIQHNRDLTEVGIQFVQFGKDPEGTQILRSLDINLQKTTDDTKWDIVDTEPADGDMWKVLLGPSNRWFDDDASPSTGP